MQQTRFVDWINGQLDDRGWSRSEAARRGGISASMLDKVIGGFSNPGLTFYRGIARAFGMPMEDVLRYAGVLPARPNSAAVRDRPRIVYEVDTEERVLALWRALRVEDVHPHRFRHTFAINFLRNGGNVYELQMALGHTTMEMVRTYLALAETDLQRAHEEASPVTRWRLKAK